MTDDRVHLVDQLVEQLLPECRSCERPVRRSVWTRRGGRCTACAAWEDLAATIGPQQAADEADRLAAWNKTAGRIRRAELQQAADRQRRRRQRRA